MKLISTFIDLIFDIASFALDLSPIGNFKCAVEAITGRSFLTWEKLDPDERALCVLGIIPEIGPAIAKTIKQTSKLAKFGVKTIKVGSKIAKGADTYFTIDEGIDLIKETGNVFRAFQLSISEARDFIRYDDGLGATALRTVFGAGCTALAPIAALVVDSTKLSYYGAGYALGKTREEMDQSLEKMGDAFSTQYDNMIDKLASWGPSGRLLDDIGGSLSVIINYYNLANLSNEGLERVQGLQNEAARRYNKEKKEREGKNESPKDALNPEKWRKNDKEKLKFNRALDKAKKKAIKDDLKKNKDKKPPFNFPFFGGGFLGGLFAFFHGLLGSFLWITMNNAMNYWKNKFGNGGYGFHTCPYGCGRPIPDSFKGCTELLAAFPDYFN